jgi:hypothetical protein
MGCNLALALALAHLAIATLSGPSRIAISFHSAVVLVSSMLSKINLSLVFALVLVTAAAEDSENGSNREKRVRKASFDKDEVISLS